MTWQIKQRRWVLRQAAGLEAFLYLSGSFTKHSVDEGHNSRLQADFIFVASRRSVQVRQKRLKQITWYNLWRCIQELYRLLKQAANNNCWMLTFHEEGNLMDLCNTYGWNFLSNVDVLIYVCFYGIFNCSSNDFSSKLENILRPYPLRDMVWFLEPPLGRFLWSDAKRVLSFCPDRVWLVSCVCVDTWKRVLSAANFW